MKRTHYTGERQEEGEFIQRRKFCLADVWRHFPSKFSSRDSMDSRLDGCVSRGISCPVSTHTPLRITRNEQLLGADECARVSCHSIISYGRLVRIARTTRWVASGGHRATHTRATSELVEKIYFYFYIFTSQVSDNNEFLLHLYIIFNYYS